jgi:hypothetical protein
MDPLLLQDLNRYRKYDTHCVRDLLRVIRNKRHHYHELSESLRTRLELDLPSGMYMCMCMYVCINIWIHILCMCINLYSYCIYVLDCLYICK